MPFAVPEFVAPRPWTIVAHLVVGLWLLGASGEIGPTFARGAEVEWLNRAALRQNWSKPVAVLWEGVPLRPALQKFAAQERCAVLLDRRIDPSRLVTLDLANVPLGEAVARIAASQELGVCRVGPVIYFGPPQAAKVLATSTAAAAEAFSGQKPPATARKTWTAEQSLSWPDLTEPKTLVTRLARDNSVTVANPEVLPYDLWAGVDLPPLSLVERFALLLVQFDSAPQISANGKTLTIAPLPEGPTIVKSYNAQAKADDQISRWKGLAPDAAFEKTGRSIRVTGRVEDHEAIDDDLHPRAAVATPGARDSFQDRFSFTVENKPAGLVLKTLAGQFGAELSLDAEAIKTAGIDLDALISYKAKDETADQILRSVATAAGLQYRRDGKKAIFTPPSGR